ncbi:MULTISPECIES: hypothetical protein [unclassified Pseudomonas]|uniref:hypothetical protein n=1 Tax=Pseudomonas sp. Ant30-3 TaxID=1488328 RepID=UPI000A74E736|nr:hypothetical protein [Pseudomonas sp. Ant30-3]
MNIRFAIFGTPLLLAVALSSSMALATSDKQKEEPEKANCPKGQVWDSKSQRCLMQNSSLVSHLSRTI